jgi:DNA-binding transcriptional ArsR family regulator
LTVICMGVQGRGMDALTVIAEPTRRRIVEALQVRERSVGHLVRLLQMSQPAVSKHLRVLREAGIVSVRTDCQLRFYRLRPEPFQDLDEWLAPYRRLWTRDDAFAGKPGG